MRMRRVLIAVAVTVTLGLAGLTPVLAAPDALFALMQRWENVEYRMQGDARLQAFESLSHEIDSLAQAHGSDSHVLTAEGVVLASYARARGGLGALDLAKRARTALERAIEIDPAGENGAAYVTLGALYQHAPGWPIAFGDEEKAGQLLNKAVEIRPEGIDTNFYYAQYLEDQGEHAAARQYARLAVDGRPRKGKASDEVLRRQAEAWLVNHP